VPARFWYFGQQHGHHWGHLRVYGTLAYAVLPFDPFTAEQETWHAPLRYLLAAVIPIIPLRSWNGKIQPLGRHVRLRPSGRLHADLLGLDIVRHRERKAMANQA